MNQEGKILIFKLGEKYGCGVICGEGRGSHSNPPKGVLKAG
jgi:hypothetical protein